MITESWKPVATALLGSWPNQVAAWGREALVAYLGELEARGMTPEQALTALRSCPADQKFPPSAPELAGIARQDPDRPIFDAAFQQLYGPGGVFGFKRAGVTISPWVLAFVAHAGRERLRLLEIDDPAFGGAKRSALKDSWTAFIEATDGREVAAIAAGGRRGAMGRLDPLAALNRVGARPQVGPAAGA